MLLVVAALAAVLLVPLTGGRWRRLSDLRVVGAPLLVVALLCQVLALVVLPGPRPLLVALHAASYVLAAVAVWRNRRVPGLPVLALGTACNAVALAANDGTVPARPQALRAAGLPLHPGGYTNSEQLAHPHLAALGDVWASPTWLPLTNVYSVGDALVLLGVVWLVHRTCGTVLGRAPGALVARVVRLSGPRRPPPGGSASPAPRRPAAAR